ncbi:Rrp15p-domain-containing protein [Aaosphaeria arxii CBS 175.79]|uniref:Rrp15p-domain-containing protein n=1 Tax=Aaosphaeria arxii CBS 175.79 TaxID=1450172 RepID=A0A6A5Y973_9PLEO|nr:Rrp15p-domain-containing protein [Aaosphaeria arxii CBS 175.79]KAF2021360.1 Rrp15p-domain-containing protein [Aaosphaeria arxii CBS 175.79]
MPSTTLKRRRTEEGMRGKTPKVQKKIKRQRYYHSSSEDDSESEDEAAEAPEDFAPVSLESSDDEGDRAAAKPKHKASIATKKASKKDPAHDDEPSDEEDLELDADEFEDGDSDDVDDVDEYSDMSETSTNNPRKVKKRNDPEAFATSISKILGTKLTSQKRSEPILSRSKAAQETNRTLADHKLTLKAQRAIVAEKRAAQEKGRVKDVLGLQSEEVATAEIVAKEKALRRTAQKGVIKLFNAVRAAQVKAEQAEKEARSQGVIGVKAREEQVKEMSKQGFLDMIAGGGKQKEAVAELEEEA